MNVAALRARLQGMPDETPVYVRLIRDALAEVSDVNHVYLTQGQGEHHVVIADLVILERGE